MFWLKQAVWSCVFAGVAATASWAAEEKKPEPAAPANATADDIAQWVKQLDADKFADRQTASEKLFGAGKSVIPALTEAATGESLEVTIRSIDLLQRFTESEVKAVKDAAKEALNKIAQSDNAGAARRAKEVLHPTKEQPQGPQGAMNMPIGGMKKIAVTSINGVNVINAEEADRKISITTNPDQSIKMEITEKVNDKDVTKKYTARNAAELKKKSPKVYETYKEYTNNNPMGGNLQINFGAPGGVAGGGAVPPVLGLPAQFGNLQGMQVIGPAGLAQGKLDLTESLKNWNESLNTLRGDLEPEKLSPEEKKALKEQIQDMKKQLDALDKHLNKAAEKPKK
jgi:hypothetical protein